MDGHQWVCVGPGRAAGEMQHFYFEPESTGNLEPTRIDRNDFFWLRFLLEIVGKDQDYSLPLTRIYLLCNMVRRQRRPPGLTG